jgi:transposase
VPATWEEVLSKFTAPGKLLPPPTARCSRCEYDLSATPEDDQGQVLCPECGTSRQVDQPPNA